MRCWRATHAWLTASRSAGRENPLAPPLDYTAVDLTTGGLDEAMLGRDEFNFSVNVQFGETTVDEVRDRLTELSREQYRRSATVST